MHRLSAPPLPQQFPHHLMHGIPVADVARLSPGDGVVEPGFRHGSGVGAEDGDQLDGLAAEVWALGHLRRRKLDEHHHQAGAADHPGDCRQRGHNYILKSRQV